MPTKRRLRSRRRREIVYDVVTVLALEFGMNPDGLTDDELKEIWQQDKTALLADWIRRYPGSRPWAWWKFEAKSPLRQSPGHAWQESQLEYLDRNNLLLEAEKKSLEATA